MVDFRYHLVSIIAVFLALALGIVVGTTALNGALLDNLKGSIGALTTEKRNLEGTIGGLRQQGASDEALTERIAPAAVQGQLAGHKVVVISAPGASGTVTGALTPLLQAAGATVVGTVQLRPDLLDPARQGVVSTVVDRVAPSGPELQDTTAEQRAASELAAALLERVPGSGLTDAVSSQVLTGFSAVDLVDIGKDLSARADLAVLVTGDPVSSPDPQVPAARARSLLAYAEAFDRTGAGAVVTGPLSSAADPGGVVRALRDDGALSQRVSSVDGADHAQGRIAVVYALREQADGGTGRYGTGPGNQGPLPSLPVR